MRQTIREQLDQDTRLELDGLKMLLRKMESAQRALKKTTDSERAKREERAKTLSEYQSEDEVMDAYGYGDITDDERDRLTEALAAGEKYVEDTITPAGAALATLNDYVKRLRSDISSLEFDLMSPEEQAARLEAAEEMRERVAARKASS